MLCNLVLRANVSSSALIWSTLQQMLNQQNISDSPAGPSVQGPVQSVSMMS